MSVSIEQALTFDAEKVVGHVFGRRYRVDRVLATGGMGLLFAGTDERANRPVAIKLLKPQDGLDQRHVRRFLREVELTAQLRHPHIVDVLDLGASENGRAPYLVMELMSGHSLQTELDQRGRLTPEETLKLLLPIMDALARVHAASVVHRDIKPANIFLGRSAYGPVVPKLIDFGIAKVQGQGAETLTGGLLGTPAYMAPEQLTDGDVGPWTDVWAMGAVFYRCLSGAPPFVGATPAEVIAKIVTASAPSLEIEGLRRTLGAAIDRALIREPELRYRSMPAFAAAVLASARSAGIDVVVSPSLERDLDCVGEEPTERGDSRPAMVFAGTGVRRAALALLLLIPACAATLLLRDPPPTATTDTKGTRSAHDTTLAAHRPVLALPRALVPPGEQRAPTIDGTLREGTPTAALEIAPRAVESVAAEPRSLPVRRRANPDARARRPRTATEKAAPVADAGFEVLVEW